MKYLKVLFLSVCFMSVFPNAYASEKVKVLDAWIPQAPPVAGVMAAYMTIENQGDSPVTITGVICDDFNGVMMHKTVYKDGMSSMVHLDSLTIKPHSKAVFKRGGMHVMLMGPKHPFMVDDKVKMILETSTKQQIPFSAVVKPATLDDHHQH